MRTLTGLFDTRSDATRAVDDLLERGVPPHDVSIISNDSAGWYAEDSREEAGAEAGAGIGALAGGAGGLLAGLGVLAIPGIGELVAVGWLVSALAGATAGAIVGGATGGLVALLTEHDIDERDAHVFAEGLKRGGTLVTARVADELAVAAEGWTRFDDKVPSTLNIEGKTLRGERGS